MSLFILEVLFWENMYLTEIDVQIYIALSYHEDVNMVDSRNPFEYSEI